MCFSAIVFMARTNVGHINDLGGFNLEFLLMPLQGPE